MSLLSRGNYKLRLVPHPKDGCDWVTYSRWLRQSRLWQRSDRHTDLDVVFILATDMHDEIGVKYWRTIAGSMSQSSYQRLAFERRRAMKRRETMTSIKDHVNTTVPRIRASSVEEVVDIVPS